MTTTGHRPRSRKSQPATHVVDDGLLSDRSYSPALLLQVLGAIPGYVFAFDRDGICLFASASGAAFLGQSPEMMVGSRLRDLGESNAVLDAVELPVVRAFSTGMPQKAVTPAPSLSGARSYEYVARLVDSTDDTPEIVVCTVLDTTEHVETETRLEAQKRDYDVAAEELQTFAEELEIHREELLVQQEELHAQADDLAEKARDVEALLGMERDTSEALRLSEARFRAIFEQAFAGVAELGPGGHIMRANGTMCELMGYAEEELLGKRFYGFTSPDDAGADVGLFSQAAGRVIDRYTLEKRVVRKDGSLIWVDSALSAIRGVLEMDDHFVLLILDISDRKKAEEELERLLLAETEARERAEKAVKARDEFLSLAAHELKTPITSLRGFSQLLQHQIGKTGTVDFERLSSSMERIYQQSKRLTTLIEGLLDVSRLEAGKMSITPLETEVSSITESALASVRGVYPTREFLFQPRARIHAVLDPLRTEQMLVNLLDNAVKFSPSDSPVEIDLALAEQDEAVISVRDHGKGISADEMERVFDRFYQGDGRRPFGGMGLGLFIARQIVELQRGTIACETPEDGGCRFVVRLPLGRTSSSK